jgi:hypothetical protein
MFYDNSRRRIIKMLLAICADKGMYATRYSNVKKTKIKLYLYLHFQAFLIHVLNPGSNKRVVFIEA